MSDEKREPIDLPHLGPTLVYGSAAEWLAEHVGHGPVTFTIHSEGDIEVRTTRCPCGASLVSRMLPPRP